MKYNLSAHAIFELAMFAIMLLFLSFCGFFTFKHCFYIWKKKKRRRRDDSLESILDLLYNEDYYYLESSTPYLPDDSDSGDELPEKGSDSAGNAESDKACFDSAPSQGRSVKWNGPDKISIDKYKVCPQTVGTERSTMHSLDDPSKRKLKRQIKFQLSGSSENVPQAQQPNIGSPSSYTQDRRKPHQHQLGDQSFQSPNSEEQTQSTTDYDEPKAQHRKAHQRSFDGAHHESRHGASPRSGKPGSTSIRKIVATSKFIGSAHRARKKMRMQSRFPAGTFRFRSESSGACSDSPPSSFEKKPLLRSSSADSRTHVKRKVNFQDRASAPWARTSDPLDEHRKHRHTTKHKKEEPRFGSPRSAFTSLPGKARVQRDNVVGSHHGDSSKVEDVEELYQKYERLEKKRYADMLKKAKSFRRENFPVFYRKHFS